MNKHSNTFEKILKSFKIINSKIPNRSLIKLIMQLFILKKEIIHSSSNIY